MTTLNGFTRAITTTAGIACAVAYYHISSFRISKTRMGNQASFTMEIWASKDAYDAKKSTLQGVPGARQFMVEKAEYDTWFAPAVLDVEDKNSLSQAYAYAKTKLSGCVDVEEE